MDQGWNVLRDARSVADNGNYIGSDVWIDASKLFSGDSRSVTLYVEAVAKGTGNQTIKVTLDPTGAGGNDLPSDTVKVTAVSVRAGVDINRDRDVDLINVSDATSSATPYEFWLNNDIDYWEDVKVGGGEEALQDLDPNYIYSLTGRTFIGRDNIDYIIRSIRDLEDLTRLQVQLDSNFIYSRVVFEWCDISSGSNPSIRLFDAVKSDDSYLINDTDAYNQQSYGTAVGRIDAGYQTDFTMEEFQNYVDDNGLAAFLFEGVMAGSGRLHISFINDRGTILADTNVHMRLMDIKDMYDHYTVADPSQHNNYTPANMVPQNYTQIGSDKRAESELTNDYILFVHGWRLQPWERASLAETSLKRLWWAGYKGHFGLFSWPTDWTDNDLQKASNYQRSEETAYASAMGLWRLLHTLYNEHQTTSGVSTVNVFAHSMGNIVVSEALRIEVTPTEYKQAAHEPMKLIKNYIPTQAASVATAYGDNSNALLNNGTLPDIYGNYDNAGTGYFEKIHAAISGYIVNFYNPEDFALGDNVWVKNQQVFKPKANSHYDSRLKMWYISENVYYGQSGPLEISRQYFSPANIKHRWFIFAYIAPAHSLALGRVSFMGIAGSIIDDNVNLNGDDFHFGGGGTNPLEIWGGSSHSAQFLATNMWRHKYWEQMLNSFELDPIMY